MKKKSLAFSLLELVVAMAILAAIAAILFPVFARAKENSRRSACMSNLHQIGLAISMYRADWDGIDPVIGGSVRRSQVGLPYRAEPLVDTYIKNHQILFCPSYAGGRKDLYSTYLLQFNLNDLEDPILNFQAMFAARGMDYPTVICDSHNPPLPHEAISAADVQYYQILRLDGRVSVRKAYADKQSQWWTW